MKGKQVVVTGGNRGIGESIVRALVRQGAYVFVVCRDVSSAQALVDELGSQVELIQGDLSEPEHVQALALKIQAKAPHLYALVHNAGVWPHRRELNARGVELAFMVNHLAPFYLNRALSVLLVANQTRVVQVSAGLYALGRPDVERSWEGKDFHQIKTYATTKLYNLVMLRRFACWFEGSGVTFNAVHPGVIQTGLGARPGVIGALLKLVKRRWQQPEHGALGPVRLVMDESLSQKTGLYFDELVESPYAALVLDEELATALWMQAERLLGLDHQERWDGQTQTAEKPADDGARL